MRPPWGTLEGGVCGIWGQEQEPCTSDSEVTAVLEFRTNLPKDMVCKEEGGAEVGEWWKDGLAVRSLPRIRRSCPSPIYASFVPPDQPGGHLSMPHFSAWVRAEDR